MNLFQDKKTGQRIGAFLCMGMLVLMIPVFVIAMYNRPSADDYVYAAQTYGVVQQSGADWPKLLQTALDTDLYFYNNWQGLYISAFLLALQPGIFDGRWYAVTTFIIVLLIFAGVFALSSALIRRSHAGRGRTVLFASLLFTFAVVQGMPNQVEGLYWYNGAMNYIPFFVLAMFLVSLLARVYTGTNPGKKAGQTILCCVLCALIGGGHHVVILLTLMVLVLAVVLFAGKRSAWPVVPSIICLAGLYLNMTSPGTQVRMSGFSSASLPEAIVKSFILAALSIVRWLDLPLVCFLLLFTPVLWQAIQDIPPETVAIRHPWLPAAGTFVLVWGMIWLPSYTMGGIGPGRLINVVWITFLIGALVSWACLLGWFFRVKKARLNFPGLRMNFRKGLLIGTALVLCIVCIGGHTVKEGLDNRFATSLEAVWELVNGTPQAYAAALDEREAILEDPSVTDAVIRPLTEDEKPALLYFTDVQPGPDNWGLTEYYGKNSVQIQQPE